MIGYNTEQELTDYATARGITLTADESVLLTRALDYIETRSYSGTKTDPEQPLQFPRNGDTEVPDALKKAHLEAALVYNDGGDPLAPIAQRVTSESVAGAVSVTYSDRGNQVTIYPILTALLAPFLASGAAGNVFGVRRG